MITKQNDAYDCTQPMQPCQSTTGYTARPELFQVISRLTSGSASGNKRDQPRECSLQSSYAEVAQAQSASGRLHPIR